MFVDILSSLACEHDGMKENSDIDEFDSDDSDSLFTQIKPCTSKGHSKSADVNNRLGAKNTGLDEKTENKHGFMSGQLPRAKNEQKVNLYDKNVDNSQHSSKDNCYSSTVKRNDNIELEARELEVGEEMESQSGPESDDSQSLISPPTTRARSRAKAAQAKNQKCSDVNNAPECVQSRVKSDVNNSNQNKNTQVKGRKNSKLSLNKGKMPLSFLGSQSDKTPLNVSRNRKYKYTIQEISSPITPLLNRNNFSLNLGNALSTSSPLNNVSSDYHCHIRSGLSPLTRGYNESFSGNKSLMSDSSILHSDVKKSVASLNSSVQQAIGRRLSELDPIKEPKSNESVQSQWSEIDESDYMKLADESNIFKAGNISCVNDSREVAKPGAIRNTSLSSVKQVHGLSSVRKHLNSPNCTNISSSSHWSEVDEEQYMTLDLEDINRMTFSTQDKIFEHNDEECNVADKTRDTSCVIIDNIDRNTEQRTQPSDENVYRESPELFEPESPPSPSLLETPPRKATRKRGLDKCASDNTEVSPLKRSLSKLKF
jgi:hypothetical protein